MPTKYETHVSGMSRAVVTGEGGKEDLINPMDVLFLSRSAFQKGGKSNVMEAAHGLSSLANHMPVSAAIELLSCENVLEYVRRDPDGGFEVYWDRAGVLLKLDTVERVETYQRDMEYLT